jgi:putative spermidine/putrescine transport system permease protein
MALPAYASRSEHFARAGLWVFSVAVLLFLVAPILVIIPLSFNSEPYFTFPMAGFSLRYYEEFFTSDRWMSSIEHSLVVGVATTILATILGTLAAQGLNRREMPMRGLLMGILISPMIVPVVITAVGMYFFFGKLGILNTFLGVILAHTALAVPFVVITVGATLSTYDTTLSRAAASLGARPLTAFRKVTLPLILPGIVSGALFAFVTSFDETVVVLFLASPDQRTLPMQMFSGIREEITPTITAAATLLIVFACILLGSIEMLRRRSARLQAG